MPEIEEGAPSKAKNKTSTKPSSNGSARKGKGKGKPAPLPEQKLMYSKHDALLFLGEDALTVEQLKDYLGWEELDGSSPRDGCSSSRVFSSTAGGGTTDIL
jgi:hypothetical protein